MEKSKDFEKFKKYYNDGLWGRMHLIAVKNKGMLTQEEVDEIVGEDDQ